MSVYYYIEMIIFGVILAGTGGLIYTSSALIIRVIGCVFLIFGAIVLFAALAGIIGEKKKQ
ncbi:hypothetical protein COS93_01065 [bacterium (Candidatus Gribaldobacteria) CG07_land_8_20_14_0_80_33_18]|uniref:Uncharacterized protein n=1 Tax=bacterium (Candidatus Gribaldobacteria) CG07_land_8_20_14_0_80_33_18 TaxID=2014272 RepID=A0A2M6Z3Q9_9BACT|nr:MAG: hypothetical protein COU04_01450 [bacterium (Candidatus Gribaldobacteria) CG10_big_fil_rev_8_21_14_0_10_33_41]PIU47044.1 MAG: hypothetical protein COS93_01065 [bacterium (Candidatus Gribaldobacteria) CG07_land_8_20_14_0_80_33_18]PJA00630.1 MAG: hypothetical protein COX75_02025 [bacterium (Candidatus Gribaldobacteria) CG_4_10_14_0_2_um_filter_33_15]PJB08213.1 MAG: hypothetical protein CO122_02325 [bacterium (Candidatus Gribaldobacteria) CG_4_9_14_3_um_filter_33_9]